MFPSVSLKSFNTFGLSQSCNRLERIQSQEQLLTVLRELKQSNAPFLVLGGGSNVVFTEDFDGTVLQMAIQGIQVYEEEECFRLEVAAGVNWHQLVCFTLENGMPGLENLALIPGTAGAAPIQNIGAYGVEFCDVCDWVEYLDIGSMTKHRITAAECHFGYRDSIFKHALKNKVIICGIGIRLAKAWSPKVSYGPLSELPVKDLTPKAVFDRVVAIRRQKLPDPEVLGNAGSFFKNPIVEAAQYAELAVRFPQIVGYGMEDGRVKLAAGWLIEQAGLKGFKLGQAGVHEQQALVLVNLGSATGADICALARLVMQRVQEKFAVRLEAEPNIIGHQQLEAENE
ncbi:UDP-N-acetylmuramate dehydrogenase [Shewanella sedimentimangrovi]|uniref:UDP-N-acetylenolpyruvoylglucosamine reductase n=1 Tax=Shewanella sedimentimangrovi TaxID=2814293 RepID=A0ABX7R0Y8_9GAMM|nr:UDP-N-acetylmuramate dehydrogenase [Shewanella sedimentimangrovi]QSX37457.1 UDP-N-acetylmuramate dehydrogenase [Shewanella sedimentimangrovi]